jgi:hypothetical protein
MRRLTLAGLLAFLFTLVPNLAFADDPPYRTVIDGMVPAVKGLTINGAAGGCDLLLDNQSGQDVLLFDMSKPPKPYRYATPPKSATPPAPLAIHLVGNWPCATLPAISEDQRWNHQVLPLLYWSLRGQVGALAFKLQAESDYDPALDPGSQWMLYLRIGAGIAIVAGVLFAIPWLLRRRRDILGAR